MVIRFDTALNVYTVTTEREARTACLLNKKRRMQQANLAHDKLMGETYLAQGRASQLENYRANDGQRRLPSHCLASDSNLYLHHVSVYITIVTENAC